MLKKTTIYSEEWRFFMRKNLIALLLIILIIALAGCSEIIGSTESEPISVAGYIVIEDNTLYLDEVEIITKDDAEKIKELGLTEQNDYPSGYYIHRLDKESAAYKLTDETVYNFVDYDLLFVGDTADDRNYSTIKKDEFILHLDTSYYDSPPAQKVPFFIQVKGDEVVSVTEEFGYTI